MENNNYLRDVKMILGILDPWVLSGYLLLVLSTLLCVVYGIVNWNKGDEKNSSEE